MVGGEPAGHDLRLLGLSWGDAERSSWKHAAQVRIYLQLHVEMERAERIDRVV